MNIFGWSRDYGSGCVRLWPKKLRFTRQRHNSLSSCPLSLLFFFQERQRYEDERSHHTEAIDKFSQSSSREIEQWIGLVDRVTAELEGARRANEDLKNRIRDADLALASRNFVALRQLLNVDHHSPDDLPAAFSRGMSSLVVSGEHERRDV